MLSTLQESKVPEAIGDVAQSARGLVASLDRGDGALPWLIQDPASRRFVQNLDRSAEALAGLSAEAKDGRGLAHALVYDREGGRLVERASDTLREVEVLLQGIRDG